MAASLENTMGIWLVALFLAAILHGMGLIQAGLYFLWYPNDKWGLKLTVICVMHLANTDRFPQGRCDFLDAKLQVMSGFSSAFLVQMQCLVSPKYKIMPIFIVRDHFSVEIIVLIVHGLKVLLSLLQLAQTVTSTMLGSFLLLDKTKVGEFRATIYNDGNIIPDDIDSSGG
ncbi:hypothetical protein DFH07DRAFT_769863 [Mycena maculata]|uniref:Uncharacterized protein n=1 Tax=Mycena maculata TaxID=230809 RepID=A0AAD7JJS8_9AGAR|nr:hypothetical protein DFH07DRAFT_769863 [Mycena maculata]